MAVRIAERHDIPLASVTFFCPLCSQGFGQPQGSLAGDWAISFHVGDDQDGGPGIALPSQCEQQEISAARCFTEDLS